MHRVVFVISGLRTLPGGIAAVDENLLIALRGLVERGEIELEIESLLESAADRPPELPPSVAFRGYGGSKPRLAARLLTHAVLGRLFLYERVGLAAATAPLALVGWCRSIVIGHGPEGWRQVTLLHELALRGATLVLTNSEYTLRRMRAYPGLNGRFCGVACPLGLAPAFALSATPPPDDGARLELTAVDGATRPIGARALLLVGRMDPTEREKGHDRMISAMPAVLARHPNAQLVFAGPGEDRGRLEGRAKEEGIGHATFFTGRASYDLLGRIYRRCFAFTMPSQQEGFGLVYLEAMNYAKPCLGCREDGAEDVIVDGETGLLISDPQDTNELSRGLCRLLDDAPAAAAMGLRGFERLHRHFTAEQFRSRFLENFRRTLAST